VEAAATAGAHMKVRYSAVRHGSIALRAVSVLLALLVGTLASNRAALADPDPWKGLGNSAVIFGPFHLALGFADQTGAPRVALVDALPPSALAGMPDGLLKAKSSPLLHPFAGNASYYDAIWSAIRAAVCSEIRQNIIDRVNHSPNTEYDLGQCVMSSRGYLVANFQEQWENDNFQQVHGRRLLLQYSVPFNGVTFWVTSPHTCNHDSNSCGVRPRDPGFTVVFTANIYSLCSPTPYANISTFALPIACTTTNSIDIDDIAGSDVAGQLQAASQAYGKQVKDEAAGLLLSGGASAPVALAGFVANTIKELGTLIGDSDILHLRDEISLWLAGTGSPTLKINADNIGAALNALFQNLYHAQLGGLKPFLVGVGPTNGLDFGLIYPEPAKPQVKNVAAAANAGSIFSPTIAVSQPEVQAGQSVPVTATYFHGTYVDSLDIAWNQTVIGKVLSTVSWGPPPVTIKTPALAFHAIGLKPATAYSFRVHECDGITCAPWSDMLTTATEAGGSSEVTFWLDADKAHPVAMAAASASGAPFVASIKIPATTPPGAHVLHAAMPGQPLASAPISVCQPGGCLPSLGVVNTSNNTLYPPGEVVVVALPVTLRGSRFAPGGAVAFFVDTAKGPKAGSALVGPLGNCQATFAMPPVAPGPHKFVAIETKPGPLGASVAVYVQAAPQ
jgi:hypothetical protein